MNCCAELRGILDSGPDGGACPPVGPCREFEGNCADIMEQFADVPVLPDFPNGMSEYFCTQFPHEEQSFDSFIVGLISIAVAIPVTYFLQVCFEIGNDNEAPESWLTVRSPVMAIAARLRVLTCVRCPFCRPQWSFSWRKLVFGMQAHRRWHYTGPLGQPHRHVRWFIRSVDAPLPETAINLWHSLRAWATGTEPPWAEEAREAEEEEAAGKDASPQPRSSFARHSTGSSHHHAARHSVGSLRPRHSTGGHHGGDDAMLAEDDVARDSGYSAYSFSISQHGSQASAAELQRYKRIITAVGVCGTYITWAAFAWFIFTYGALIYKLLGDSAEEAFARCWGVSYGMNAATEWRSIAEEALKGAIFLLMLERLGLTLHSEWLEEHIDYLGLCVARLRCFPPACSRARVF